MRLGSAHSNAKRQSNRTDKKSISQLTDRNVTAKTRKINLLSGGRGTIDNTAQQNQMYVMYSIV